MSYYYSLNSQRSMAFDETRNAAYIKALEKVVTPESVVLDLGAGLGILGLQAAKLGAKKVYLVEPEDVVCVAREIIKANGLDDRVECLQGKIETITLPEPVDIITSVFTGNFLLSEDLLPSLFFARDHYLKPNGILLPSAAEMEAVPISVPTLFEETIEAWSVPHLGIDHSPGRTYANQEIYWLRKELKEAKYLAQPQSLMGLDFHTATSTHCQTQVTFPIQHAGLCHGFAGWFKMQLGEDWLSTAPHEPPLHWSVAYLPLDPPIEVQDGDTLKFGLTRPSYGDWSWQALNGQSRQQRSTFFASALSPKRLRQQTLDFCPKLNDKGSAASYVLSQSDGTLSVRSMAEQLTKQFPQQFPNLQKATPFVQGLLERFSL